MDVQTRHLHAVHHVHGQLTLIAALLLTALPRIATAQISIEVTPLRVELKAAPGGTYTQTVTLTNRDASAVRVHARVDDWYLTRDGTPQFKLADRTTTLSAASWVRINPAEQVLQPGATGQVRFTTTTPAQTMPAGYRAAIMFDLLPAGADAVLKVKGVQFQGRVATLLYVTVGEPKPAVELIDLQTRASGPTPGVVATLRNKGRVHVRTKGQMLVYGKSGAVVRRIVVPDVPVLPESEREVVIRLAEEGQQPLPAGEYRVEIRIDVGLSELLVGETTVTIGK